MTPAARVAAAASVLDRVLAGAPAEAALIGWARGARYAGSGDRAAVRDLVYDSLRRRGRHALRAGLSGAEDPRLTGRVLMLGVLAEAGTDPDTLFTGQGHAPLPLTDAERAGLAAGVAGGAADDLPAWLHGPLREALGADFPAYSQAMTRRAPVWLRVNSLRATLAEARAALAAEDIATTPHPACVTALCVTEGARRIARSRAYLDGLVELQDLSPQRAVAALGDLKGLSVLDFCAGGGGKALAMAAQGAARVVAHDANPARMADLPARAARAGARIEVAAPQGRFDLVLTDVPCSGSGTWGRDPDARWRFSPGDLTRLAQVQAAILDETLGFLRPGGRLAYMTCSVLRAENEDRIADFSACKGLNLLEMRRFGPPGDGDGFFLAVLAGID